MLWIAVLGAFKLWMIFDAVQTRNRDFIWVIAVIPGGEFIYFLTVKIHDPTFRRLFGRFAWKREPTLDELRYHARETPSFANRLELARGVFRAGALDEAEVLLKELARTDPNDREVLYGLACVHVKQEKSEDAAQGLERLLEIEFAFRDYAGAVELVSVYERLGEHDRAFDLMRKLVRTGNRLEHRLLLAKKHAEREEYSDARVVLDQVLQDFKHAPKYVKRNNKQVAKQAAEMHKSMSAS